MIDLDRVIEKSKLAIHMIMQVHDELVFEVSEGIAEEASDIITNSMVGAAELAVPLIIDVGIGSNWDEAH